MWRTFVVKWKKPCRARAGEELDARAYRAKTLADWEAGQRLLPRQALIGVAMNDAVRMSLANNNRYVVFDENYVTSRQ